MSGNMNESSPDFSRIRATVIRLSLLCAASLVVLPAHPLRAENPLDSVRPLKLRVEAL